MWTGDDERVQFVQTADTGNQGTGEGGASQIDGKSRARSWWGIRGWFLGDDPIDDGGAQVVQVADTGTDGKTTSKSGGSLIATMGDLADDAGSYVGRSSKSLILGDWTDEKPTGLSIGAGIGLGVLGVDLPLDLRDLSHTLTHREWSYKWGETLAYNTIGLIPLIGVIKNLKNAKKLKYLDDAGELAKRSDDAADAAGDAGRKAGGADDTACEAGRSAPSPSSPPSDLPPDGPSGLPSDLPPKTPTNPSDTPTPDGGITRGGNKSRLVFDGMEVRGVRNLSHVDEGTLRAMSKKGFAAKDTNGNPLQLHHLDQNPAGPVVEIPDFRHRTGNDIQHPFGNSPGVGLSPEQRAAFDAWRLQYWRNRAAEELVRRGLTP